MLEREIRLFFAIKRELSQQLGTTRGWIACVLLWTLILLLIPVFLEKIEGSFLPAITAGVVAQSIVVVLALLPGWGALRVSIIAVILVICSWASEAIGVATGIPFGQYHYSDLLTPKVLEVPLLIPVAWMMMLIPSWGVAYTLLINDIQSSCRSNLHHVKAAALTGAAMVAWDFYVDPQMVALGVWEWRKPSCYFGTPLTNFVGWWSVAFLLTILVRPVDLPRRPLLVIYSVVWILEFLGLALIWGQPGPALVGFVGMGGLVVLAWRKEIDVDAKRAAPGSPIPVGNCPVGVDQERNAP